MNNAKNISTLKAISQNLMHSNLSVTDGIYGILSETDVRKQIRTLGNTNEKDSKNLTLLLKEILEELENKKGKV